MSRIVEVNGIKLEIDERTARTVDSYKVGDRVKVLVKEYSSYNLHVGVIVGFAAFKERPCIEVMYVNPTGYDTDPLKFIAIHADTEGTEIAPLNEAELVLDKDDVLDRFAKGIREAQAKLDDLTAKRDYFTAKFAKAFVTEEERIGEVAR